MTSLKKRVLFFSFFALLVPLGLSAIFDIQAIFDSYRSSLGLRLQIHAESLRFAIEKVQNLGLPVVEMEGLNLRCQEIVKRDPDVAYCLIEGVTGEVMFAHDPTLIVNDHFPPRNEEKKLTRFEGFRNWGVFYDLSLPILDASRETTGWIRIGFSRDVLVRMARDSMVRNLLILLGVFLAIYSLIVVYIRRHLINPIESLCGIARRVTEGDFNVEPIPLATREFQTLSDDLNTMAVTLGERDAQIAAGIEELEHSNSLLQDAYEAQEAISRELDRNQKLYQTLVDQASEAILVCNDRDEIQLFNSQAESLFGVSASKAVNCNLLSFFERIGADTIDDLYEMYLGVLKSGLGAEEFSFRGGNAEPRKGMIKAACIKGGAGKVLVQMIVHDITSEYQAKLNLERSAAELARLNRMKNAFLGMVSHELKTPLTIILGYADLLETHRDVSDDTTLKTSLGHIIEASERLGRVIQDMVDASDLDGHRVVLSRNAVQVNDLLSSCASSAVDSSRLRQQQVRFEFDPSLPEISGDRERLAQMFDHLLNNAIKFTPDHGQITVRSYYLKPGTVEAESCSCRGNLLYGCIEVVIADSGIGIPDEDRERVFDKFYGSGPIEEHSSSRVSFKGKGVGLGLTIVQGIVELHGGEVWVDQGEQGGDGVPRGSAFHVRLPVTTAVSN